MPKHRDGTVAIAAIAQYARTKVVLHYMVGRLLAFDTSGDGCLREHDVENYVFEAIPGVPELAALQENFYPFYVFTAVRKFFFFLDPNRTGKLAVRDCVSSRVFAEWMRLLPLGHPDFGPAGGDLEPRQDGDHMAMAERIVAGCMWRGYGPSGAGSGMGGGGGGASPPASSANWFSAANALRVYSQYLQLDVDQNGMLTAQELAAYRGGILTSAAIERIFEECHTYGGEIDFKVYLDLVLALENRSSAAANRFLFRLLDINHVGRIGLSELRHFCKYVAAKLVASGQEAVDLANVCDEIFDMVHPRRAGTITLEDILRCKVGHTACSILLDAAAFFAYDRREELKGDTGGEAPEADSEFEG
jgi:serine/threonine-protein phosphatase 2A regulatory subunit B''